jgi:eukaryotic-like serine/threonine-protein kinase
MIGQRLSHYQIVEQIGAGGMGVVYRAHDEQLDRDVAIKVLPSGSLADEAARKRFRQEALSLARLNHPNIATVHEFGTQNDINFLVTEFIPGITLDMKLAGGALEPKETIRLGVQLAEGLAAAHQQGIVHRDLKPGNLRVTPDGRLKILDFGLAQFMPHASDFGLTMTMTSSQEITGTLPYMAPEQLCGQPADARTDLWSAGAVLYEMATGRRPFPQTPAALLISSILNQSPDPPSSLRPELPLSLGRVALKALSKDPAQRYQTAEALSADLVSALAPSAPVSVPAPASRRLALPLIGTLLIFCAIGFFVFRVRQRKPAASIPGRRSIAVLGFKNTSGIAEKSWLSTALSEMLTTELSQGDQLRTIPGESIAQMKVNLSLPDADSYSQQTLARIRQNLGSDEVVLGSYLPLGNGILRLDLRLQDAAAGDTLASISEKGSESEIDTLITKAGAELRAKLGIGALSDSQSASVRASLPSNQEAARAFSEALQKLRLFDALSARDLLEKAVALEPGFAPAHAALAQAWSTLGYDPQAKEQAKQALDLSSGFSREERLLIEGRSHELLGEQPEAVENYRALWRFFPDRIDYGLSLIRAQIAAGKGADAQTTLAEIHKLAVSDADSARIDLAASNIAASQSDFKQQQYWAESAANRGRTVGANLLVAESMQMDAMAAQRMGQSDKAIQLAAQSRQLYSAAGNRQGAARTLLMTSDVLFDQGDFEGSKKKVEEALPIFRKIGSQKSIRGSLERLGNVYYAEGKLTESKKYHDETLRDDLAVHDPVALASDYGNIANDMDGLGDLRGALKMQEQSLAAFNEVGDRRGSSATLNNLGNLYVEMGNLDLAEKTYSQAIVIAREIAFRSGEPYPVAGLGDVLVARGKLDKARENYQEALKICSETHDEDFIAQIHTSLAYVALLQNNFIEGETLARQTTAIFEKSSSPGNNASAHAILARALLAQGKLEAAREAATRAIALSHQVTGETARDMALLADARVKAKSGKSAEARQELESMLASARRHGYRIFEYDARLALAQVDLWSGSASASSHLRSLQDDAKAEGLLLFASQAEGLLKPPPLSK